MHFTAGDETKSYINETEITLESEAKLQISNFKLLQLQITFLIILFPNH